MGVKFGAKGEVTIETAHGKLVWDSKKKASVFVENNTNPKPGKKKDDAKKKDDEK
ncbi:hypothetical protein HRF59_11575 [Bacillus velezensis]|uniref:hypothetical protein n=1 Tax=Bacillus amyloliquefaciens group TaxID=1938374 RepID=UPI00140525F8|nr:MULTISPECIES: hypothetical protein [Bacillus amyloliquefaciens group]NHN22744.1 hypothetical protein [Bacillus amyloliquefaciens]NMP61893.1 hypothetical protein [Bacillus velezensis]NRG14328.1 hypothetical protein [Bacillus velezensis]